MRGPGVVDIAKTTAPSPALARRVRGSIAHGAVVHAWCQ